MLGRVGVVAGQRVPVGDEVEAVVLLLQRGPVVQRPGEVAKVELSGRAHARDDARFHGEQQHRSKKLVGGMMIRAQHAGQQQRIENHESVLAHGRESAAHGGQQTGEHVAAVERRNRHHVEDGEQNVDQQTASSSIAQPEVGSPTGIAPAA